MIDCLVVGAGISGLLAACKLHAAGQSVIVLDKGNGVGGRMATRRIHDSTFDHGAQFFTVRDDRFGVLVDAWLKSGLVVEWSRGFADRAGEMKEDGHARYRGAQGMTTIPKHLAADIDVRTSAQVTAIDLDSQSGWLVQTEQETYEARRLLLTPPVPQSLALLDAGNYRLPVDVRHDLDAISYNPCIALMARLDGPSAVPAPGGIQLNQEPIYWMADNYRKGISSAYGVTIHAAPDFSHAHFDDLEAAAKLLFEAAAPYLGDAQVSTYQVQSWRYSQPLDVYADTYLALQDGPPLVLAGDAFAGPRVEGAALSGLTAGDYLLES
ncbi:MAG: FAD-dependent oxidoreductase [Anaerolineae bacterium]|nr:FAD-dependent oxidoreductase [Anaerolineae bacterium]